MGNIFSGASLRTQVLIVRMKNSSRILKLSYLLTLAVLLPWMLLNYLQVVWKYMILWNGVPRVDPLNSPLHKPLVFLEGGVKGDLLIVRLLRTYVVPGAEDLLVIVNLYYFSDVVRLEVRKRVTLGSQVTFVFPLNFGAEQLAGYAIEVYLDGKLVAVQQGGQKCSF